MTSLGGAFEWPRRPVPPPRRAGSKAPAEEQILTDVERNQLIAVLETVLAVLKAVEKGLLKKAREMLGRASKSAAE